MSGMLNSATGMLGLSSGPQFSQGYNSAQDQLNNMNDATGNRGLNNALTAYANGDTDLRGALGSGDQESLGNEWERSQFGNDLATSALTGSKFATDQVQNNPILGSLFGKGGQLSQAEDKLGQLNSQGFQLTPDDQTLYGQTSGNIARMFGTQGNQVSQDLANRGLASAPSGAAGAMFSGLAGSQNEQLAQAQQQIMQQRFQNTQNQISQQQNFINSLGQQAGNDINQQYGRQLSGAQNQRQGLTEAANVNLGVGNQNLASQEATVGAQPQNLLDMAQGGANAALGSAGKTGGQKLGNSMFSPTPTPGMGAGAAA